MDSGIILLAAGMGMLIGAAVAWLVSRTHVSRTHRELEDARADLAERDRRIIGLNSDVVRLDTELESRKNAADEMRDAFKALSSDALRDNNQSFLELAKSTFERLQTEAKGDLESKQKEVEALVAPIKESLGKVDFQLQEIEKTRREAYGGLSEQVRSLMTTQEKLHSETENLVRALRTPNV
ncbi:MAG: DNA recombination protein RmuC, partial [bacterium]